jgi:hypothetical protein
MSKNTDNTYRNNFTPPDSPLAGVRLVRVTWWVCMYVGQLTGSFDILIFKFLLWILTGGQSPVFT